MLDTLLEIGRILREDGLKHHIFFKEAPLDPEVEYFSVPVDDDGNFQFSNCRKIEDESKKKVFFYWEYQASKSESDKKYIFGDIYKSFVKKTAKTGKVTELESGNYFLQRASKKKPHSFYRFQDGINVDENSKDKKKKPKAGPQVELFCDTIINFRKSFADQEKEIHELLAKHPSVYLHFDFKGKSWHQTPAFETVQNIVRSNFAHTVAQGTVINSFLHHTIGVGREIGQERIPGFDESKGYRVRTFANTGELENLFYALDIYDQPIYSFKSTKIVVLPRGDKIKAPQLERFFDWRLPEVQSSEEARLAMAINACIDEDGDRSTLLKTDAAYQFAQFDFIFVKKGGSKFTPDSDMIEVSGLERSKLAEIAENIRQTRYAVEERRAKIPKHYQKGLEPLSIISSLMALTGDSSKEKKKFQSHLRIVLPQIFTESYFRDPILLPSLIAKTEFSLREGWSLFPRLQFDFEFLTLIQINGENTLKQIKDSPSFELGQMLGKLAQPFRNGNKIASFDKNYAGLLSRRIGSIAAVAKLQVEINQKLTLHSAIFYKDRDGVSLRDISHQLAQKLSAFDVQAMRYDKNECALGFFESYHAPFEKKQIVSSSDLPETDETQSSTSEN